MRPPGQSSDEKKLIDLSASSFASPFLFLCCLLTAENEHIEKKKNNKKKSKKKSFFLCPWEKKGFFDQGSVIFH
jgi:hypothetical protein